MPENPSQHHAILGAELKSIALTKRALSVEDSILEAVRVWAPAAVVTAIRLPSDERAFIKEPVVNGRVYAKHRGSSANLTFQVSLSGTNIAPLTATVDLRLRQPEVTTENALRCSAPCGIGDNNNAFF